MKQKFAFWGALCVLLTVISPNLEAGTIDPTTYPWMFDAKIKNAAWGERLSASGIEDSILTFTDLKDLGGGNIQLKGEIDIFEGEKFWGTAKVGGWKFSNDVVLLGMRWGSLTFELVGFETEPGRYIGGLKGLGSSDIVGSWEALQTDLPAALGLFVVAIGSVFLFSKKRSY